MTEQQAIKAFVALEQYALTLKKFEGEGAREDQKELRKERIQVIRVAKLIRQAVKGIKK